MLDGVESFMDLLAHVGVHMRPVARPEKVAESTADFFAKLASEWRAMAAGKG
mgnify:CR=1 FL=1